MRILGIVLVALGVLALVYGGIDYNKSRTVLEMGSMSVTATDHKNIPIPAIVGVIAVIGGAVLLWGGKRRLSPR